MDRLRSVVLAIFLLLCLTLGGATRPIIVGGSFDYPPYSFLDEEGRPTGLAVDLSYAAWQVLGVRPVFQLEAWGDVLESFRLGQTMAVHDIVISEQRASLYAFTAPYFVSSYRVFAKKEAPSLQTFEDLRDKKMVIIEGDIGHDYLLEQGITGSITYVSSYADAIFLLESSDFQYTMMDELAALYWMKTLGAKSIETTEITPFQLRYAFATLPENGDVALSLSGAFAILRERGTLQEITSHWMHQIDPFAEEKSARFQNLLYILLGFGLLVFLLLGWSFALRKVVRQRTEQLGLELTKRLGKESELQEAYEYLSLTLKSIGDAVISTDDEGRVTLMNRVCEELTGWSSEEARGLPLDEVFRIINAYTRKPTESPVKEVIQTGSTVGLANHTILIAKNGEERHIADSAAPIKSKQGQVIGVILVFRDITSEYKAKEALEDSERRYRGLFEQSLNAIGLFEPLYNEESYVVDFSVLEVNKVYEEITGLTKELMAGKTLRQLHAGSESSWLFAMREVLENKAGGEYEILDPVSDKAFMARIYSPSPSRIVSVISDVTEQKKAEQALKKSEAYNRSILDLIPDFIFRFSNQGVYCDILAGNEGELVLPRAQLIGKSIFEVLPLDLATRFFETMNEAIRTNSLQPIEYELKQGSVSSWYEARLIPTQENGLFCIVRNITAEKTAQMELTKSQGVLFRERLLLRTVIDNLPCAVYVKDKDSRKLLANRQDLINMGLESEEEALGKTDDHFFEGEQARHARDTEARIFATGIPLLNEEELLTIATGEKRWYLTSKLPLRDRKGEVEALVGIGFDITDRKNAEDALKHLTFHDSLTGLYNRRFLEEELIRLDASMPLPISLIMADVNGLKIVNDSLGHQEGDRLLRKVARVLKEACRKEDVIARWGGDEFVIVLPKTPGFTAQEICNRIHRISEALDERPIRLSISLGVATKMEPKQSMQSTLKKAEDLMYQFKSSNSQSSRSALVTSLQRTLQEKSHETEQHASRMRDMAMSLGRALGLTSAAISELGLLAVLHDLGKVAIPEAILTKEGPLTHEEWEIMKKHPEIGHRIALASPDLIGVAEGILAHHERFDGKGYPRGLKGHDIPLVARIITVVDAFEAMTSDRPYRRAIGTKEALEELKRCAASQFDPQLVDLFLSLMEKGEIATAYE